MKTIAEILILNGFLTEEAEWFESLIHDDMKPIILFALIFLEGEEQSFLYDMIYELLEMKGTSVVVNGIKTNYLLESDAPELREAVRELDELDDDFQPEHSPVTVFLENGVITID